MKKTILAPKYFVMIFLSFSVLILGFSFRIPQIAQTTSYSDIKSPLSKLSAPNNYTDVLLKYSSYIGGDSYDAGIRIVVDNTGCPLISGETESSNFPVTDGSTYSFHDIFLTKLSPEGNAVVFSTLIPSSSTDLLRDMAIDSNGDIWLVGGTFATDFPTTANAYHPTYTNISTSDNYKDGFLCKLSGQNGSLLYSSYLGANGDVLINAVSLDQSDNIWITGVTGASDFPTITGAVNDTLNGLTDGFVCKFSADGTQLKYSTFIGGLGWDSCYDVVLDHYGNVWVTGTTYDTRLSTFPITENALNSTHGGDSDIFIAMLEYGTKYKLGYSTYHGGSQEDAPTQLLFDDSHHLWIIGRSQSDDFPITGSTAFQTSNLGGYGTEPGDIVVSSIQVTPYGSSLLYSTFIGGTGSDVPHSAVFDGEGNLWIIGRTASDDFPVVNAFDDTFNSQPGDDDVFVTQLLADTSGLGMSTYIGGDSNDLGYGIACDAQKQRIWMTGIAMDNFPLINAFDTVNYGSLTDGFVGYFQPPLVSQPPTNLTAIISKDNRVVLLWNEPVDSGDSPVSLYNIYRETAAISYAKIAESNSTWFIDATVQVNATYSYKVTASNTAGESDYSNEVTVTVLDDCSNPSSGNSIQDTPFITIQIFAVAIIMIALKKRRSFTR
ncbi:MAG: fibronectin type III domain-containing protein [Candidatus Odinarchaeota archaeon]